MNCNVKRLLETEVWAPDGGTNCLAHLHALPFFANDDIMTCPGQSGCDAWTLARIAGHASIDISALYDHPFEYASLDASSRLGGHKIGHSQNNVPQLPVAKDVTSGVQ
jgi:hypothetical protein